MDDNLNQSELSSEITKEVKLEQSKSAPDFEIIDVQGCMNSWGSGGSTTTIN